MNEKDFESEAKTESLEESRRVIVDSNGRHFRAESFDRFGDDLTEELLSYLSVEDKIRLQSVAKQWNRCLRQVLRRHTSLQIFSDSLHIDNIKQLLKSKVKNRL